MISDTSKDVDKSKDVKRMEFIFLIDASDSMKENNALKQAIEGASGAISGLPEESYFNVLIFGSNV